MGCGVTCIKVSMNILNALYLISSIILVGVCIYLWNFMAPTQIAIFLAIAALSLVSGILGCTGICKEHPGITAVYAAIILILILFNLCLTFFGTNEENLKSIADAIVTIEWEREINQPGAMDALQLTYKCCGKNNISDYETIKRNTPTSCYSGQIQNILVLHRGGCVSALQKIMITEYERQKISNYIGVVISLIIFAGAVYLARHFKRQKRDENFQTLYTSKS